MATLQGLAWLLALQLAGEVLARALRLPLPGPVIGMVLLMAALRWPAVRVPVAGVARFLLAHLSLLFVPVGVGVVAHIPTLVSHGVALALALVLSTLLAIVVGALTFTWVARLTGSRADD